MNVLNDNFVFNEQGKVAHVHISKMTGKLEGFNSISTNTVTNAYCIKQWNQELDTICKHCFSWSMLLTYRKNMQACLERNSNLLSEQVLPIQQLPSVMDLFFRFSSHGELINENHLINYINICLKNPLTTFALWTKRADLINKFCKNNTIPKNLILVYSNPKKSKVLRKIPKNFHKTFNNVLEHELVNEQNCTGQKCKDCLACYKFDSENIIIEKVKKY